MDARGSARSTAERLRKCVRMRSVTLCRLPMEKWTRLLSSRAQVSVPRRRFDLNRTLVRYVAPNHLAREAYKNSPKALQKWAKKTREVFRRILKSPWKLREAEAPEELVGFLFCEMHLLHSTGMK